MSDETRIDIEARFRCSANVSAVSIGECVAARAKAFGLDGLVAKLVVRDEAETIIYRDLMPLIDEMHGLHVRGRGEDADESNPEKPQCEQPRASGDFNAANDLFFTDICKALAGVAVGIDQFLAVRSVCREHLAAQWHEAESRRVSHNA